LHVDINVSEKHTAFIFRAEMKVLGNGDIIKAQRKGRLGGMAQKTACFSETLVCAYEIMRRHNPEEHNLHCCEKKKCHDFPEE
jgi:hypothetical protein